MIVGAHTHTRLSDPQVNEYTVSLFGLESVCLLVTLSKCIAYSPACVCVFFLNTGCFMCVCACVCVADYNAGLY